MNRRRLPNWQDVPIRIAGLRDDLCNLLVAAGVIRLRQIAGLTDSQLTKRVPSLSPDQVKAAQAAMHTLACAEVFGRHLKTFGAPS